MAAKKKTKPVKPKPAKRERAKPARPARRSRVERDEAVSPEMGRPDMRGHNSLKTEQDLSRAHEQLSKLENVLETAKGKVRQAYKDLRADGFNIAALKRARKDLRDDPEEQQLEFGDYIAYRELLGVEESVEEARQAGERAANVASIKAAERGNGNVVTTISTNESLAAANQEGLDAGLAGKSKEINPYEDSSPENLKWNAGWVGGQRQIATRGNGESASAA